MFYLFIYLLTKNASSLQKEAFLYVSKKIAL